MSKTLSQLVEIAADAQSEIGALELDARLAFAAEAAVRLRRAAPEIVDSAVREVGQPRKFAAREVESALGLIDALPLFAEAIRSSEAPAVSGITEFAVASLRRGLRLACGQLAGMGANRRHSVGAGRGERGAVAALRSSSGDHDARTRCARRCMAEWRDRAGQCSGGGGGGVGAVASGRACGRRP